MSFEVTMTIAFVVARLVSYSTGTEPLSTPTLLERGYDKTLVQQVIGGIEANGSRAPGPHRAAQAHLR